MAKTRFHSALEDRVRKAVSEHQVLLSSGNAPDFPSYKEQCGYIRGLLEVLHLCEEIEEDFNK